jgi:pyruvate dehydrogenase (quinone)
MRSSTDRSSPHHPAITAEMARGFTAYMLKAVLSGRAEEIIDLARSNLWR